jgi:hypothetical protein
MGRKTLELATHKPKSFFLIVRGLDGTVLLQERFEDLYAACGRLIDWSVEKTGRVGWAVLRGPQGFYLKHRIKEWENSAWIDF